MRKKRKTDKEIINCTIPWSNALNSSSKIPYQNIHIHKIKLDVSTAIKQNNLFITNVTVRIREIRTHLRLPSNCILLSSQNIEVIIHAM